MRLRFTLFVLILTLGTTALSAKEVWLSIGGTTAGGTFRTDARILNPSNAKDISVQAWYLPVGNQDNSAVQPVTITVPKRQMAVYNDVVTSLFHSTGLGAIRLVSSDDFVATQRIYAVAASGTLGQFVGGVDSTAAKTKGVIIQLKSGGSFRTNVGAANPNGVTANVTWHLYDHNNALVGTAKVMPMPPYAVIAPTGIASFADAFPGDADLTDAWISYTSDQPIVAYGSVIDNGTTDPTYVPASEDTGALIVTPPINGNKTFDVTTHSFAIDIEPSPEVAATLGDTVTFRITGRDTTHGFRLIDPKGRTLIDVLVPPGGAAILKTVTLTNSGTYSYFCTMTTCGAGHASMVGSFAVGGAAPDPPPGY